MTSPCGGDTDRVRMSIPYQSSLTCRRHNPFSPPAVQQSSKPTKTDTKVSVPGGRLPSTTRRACLSKMGSFWQHAPMNCALIFEIGSAYQ